MKTRIKNALIILCALTVLVFAGTGCKHTAHGAGQDIQNMGEKIQDKTN